jgi:phenylacetic acid degradation operon negative regulatory protein
MPSIRDGSGTAAAQPRDGAMRPQDLALTMLGTYLREPGQRAWSGGMVELLGEFGFSVEASRAALNRLAMRGLIGRVKSGREVFYRLTPEAQALLAEGDARIFRFGRDAPDGDLWTVLWHSLPERRRTERAHLASRLRFLGFGSVQDATWMAPHDREQEVVGVLESLGISGHAYVLVGRPAVALNTDAVLTQAWDLAEVTRRYTRFLEEFGPLKSRRSRAALADGEAFVVRTRAIHRFRRFPLLDPELPDEAMPEPRLRPAVVKLFDLVFDGLRAPAERHFREVIRADAVGPDSAGRPPADPQAPTS